MKDISNNNYLLQNQAAEYNKLVKTTVNQIILGAPNKKQSLSFIEKLEGQ